jgi:secretory phospholipase A2
MTNVVDDWSKNTSPLRGLLIFPGTKWCGAGDIADHYYDLGYHSETDKCCR